MDVQIISLGCGYDASYYRFAESRQMNVKGTGKLLWIDVDFPDLIKRKRNQALVHASQLPEAFSDDKYYTIGCDLRNLQMLQSELMQLEGFSCSKPTLLVSECVITYMPVNQSDAVIKWASTFFDDAVFTIYEQIEPEDAFACTMLQHFKKLQAPIYAIHQYPSLNSQRQRLIDLGWNSACILDMNQFWLHCLDEKERLRIQSIEIFDEYEEWFMKCQHYFVSLAYKETRFKMSNVARVSVKFDCQREDNCPRVPLGCLLQEQLLISRWGQIACYADGIVIVHGGFGRCSTPEGGITNGMGRCDDVMIFDEQMELVGRLDGNAGPGKLMYHSSVKYKDDIYIFGGRTSPVDVNNNLWRYNIESQKWIQMTPSFGNLPAPRFRHACSLLVIDRSSNEEDLPEGTYLIIHGGLSGNDVLPVHNDVWIYSFQSNLWTNLAVTGLPYLHSHGIVFSDKSMLILGGMNDRQELNTSSYRFKLTSSGKCSEYHFKYPLTPRMNFQILSLKSSHGIPFIVMIGGIIQSGDRLKLAYDLDLVYLDNGMVNRVDLVVDKSKFLPLGLSVFACPNSCRVKVIGGGAICFSMGAFTNSVVLELNFDQLEVWKLLSPLKWILGSKSVPRVHDEEEMDIFAKRLDTPFIINSSIGECTSLWRKKWHLLHAVEKDEKVSVHTSKNNRLKFSGGKNYTYETWTWQKLVDFLFSDERDGTNVYVRSIGANPRKQQANIYDGFPGLVKDLHVPPLFKKLITSSDKDNAPSLESIELGHHCFSSILRVSTPDLHLWTHYDIMNNILIQVVNEKFVTLFPPDQAENLDIPPGINMSSSPVLDVFSPYSDPYGQSSLDEKSNLSCRTTDALCKAWTCVLHPGDILFIPALWFHNTYALSRRKDEPVMSVNIFWHHLEKTFYDKKDLYGNKDLVPAVEAFKSLQQCINFISDFEREAGLGCQSYANFYKMRLCQYMDFNFRKAVE